ncbi:hypothetical protein BE20_28050 [Sorangium cellulosum]|nr:hypothetical protein BE20_28050 [Sorangium cellulosum]
MPAAIASIWSRARAECSVPYGASARDSSTTLWRRCCTSFSRQRRMISSRWTGSSHRCTRGGLGASLTMATKRAEMEGASKGKRAVRSW